MKQKRNFATKQIYALTAAVLSSLAMPLTCGATETEAPYLATEYSKYDGKTFAEIRFMAEGEGLGNSDNSLVTKATYSLDKDLISATVAGTDYWTNIIAPEAEYTSPWQIFITTDNGQNASAASYSINSDEKEPASKSYKYDFFYLREQLTNKADIKPLTYEDAKENVLPAGKDRGLK